MTTTLTMTPLEAIAYLHGTLPARPELYGDDEHTAALIALGPLVVAQPESLAQVRSDFDPAEYVTRPGLLESEVRSDEAQPAEGMLAGAHPNGALTTVMEALAPFTDTVAVRILEAARARVINLTPENLGLAGDTPEG